MPHKPCGAPTTAPGYAQKRPDPATLCLRRSSAEDREAATQDHSEHQYGEGEQIEHSGQARARLHCCEESRCRADHVRNCTSTKPTNRSVTKATATPTIASSARSALIGWTRARSARWRGR